MIVLEGYLVIRLIQSTAEGETAEWSVSVPCATLSSLGAISLFIDDLQASLLWSPSRLCHFFDRQASCYTRAYTVAIFLVHGWRLQAGCKGFSAPREIFSVLAKNTSIHFGYCDSFASSHDRGGLSGGRSPIERQVGLMQLLWQAAQG